MKGISPSAAVLLVIAALLSLSVLVLGDKGMRVADMDGNDLTTVDKVEYDPTPDHIYKVDEDGDGGVSLFTLKKKFNVVCILVIQEYDCSRCAGTHRQFVEAADKVMEEADRVVEELGHQIAFATIDAEKQADEFADMMADNPDFQWMVPSILVFKQEMQRLRRPPIMFNINERLADDLPRFLIRFVGPDMTKVTTESQLISRITSAATEGVSFGWWGKTSQVFERMVERERFNVLIHHLPSVEASDATSEEHSRLIKRFNPNMDTLLAYIYTDDIGQEEEVGKHGAAEVDTNIMDHISIQALRIDYDTEHKDFHKLWEKIQNFVENAKTYRPGHKYDLIHKFHIDDVVVPETVVCLEKSLRSKTGDKIFVDLTGYDLEVGTQFLVKDGAELEVGTHQTDVAKEVPHLVLKQGLVGMCPGMVRKIVIPAHRSFRHENDYPPNLSKDSRAIVEVKMLEDPNSRHEAPEIEFQGHPEEQFEELRGDGPDGLEGKPENDALQDDPVGSGGDEQRHPEGEEPPAHFTDDGALSDEPPSDEE